ncbi:MAG: hypothetical protein KF893_20665 [Caldilineaceae bacterium]|nr:hypothetical protein [Caldilineaceae bacterium]
MRLLGPVGLMLIGFVFLAIGFALPFLMVIQLVEPGFLLVFLSYMASVGGLIMGVIGSALFVRERQE